MNVRELQAVRAVIARGTVTKAAEQLGVSQPALSNLVANLERRVGFKLFDRVGGRQAQCLRRDAYVRPGLHHGGKRHRRGTANTYANRGLECRQFDPAIPFDQGIMYPANRPRSLLVQAFADVLKRAMSPYVQA